MIPDSMKSTSVLIGSGLLTFAVLIFGIGWGMEYVQAPPPAPAPALVSDAPLPTVLSVSPEQAALIALHTSVGAQLQGTPSLMTLAGEPTYVVPLDWGTVYVHATTGQILRNDTTPPMPYQPAPTAPPDVAAPLSKNSQLEVQLDAQPPAYSVSTDVPITPEQAEQVGNSPLEVNPDAQQPTDSVSTGAPITPERAAKIARDYAGGGVIHKVERDTKNGIETYEVKFTDGREVYVDVNTGAVVYAELN